MTTAMPAETKQVRRGEVAERLT